MVVHPIYEKIQTARLELHLSHPVLAEQVCDYYVRNRAHLQPYEPTREDVYFTAAYQRAQMEMFAAQAQQGEGYRYWAKKPESDKIIGMVSLGTIVHGPFCSSYLSYSCDKDICGQGYATEMAGELVRVGFEKLKLHRIEASVLPVNTPSRRVLAKLGFTEEGTARQSMRVNGTWEDLIRMARLCSD